MGEVLTDEPIFAITLSIKVVAAVKIALTNLDLAKALEFLTGELDVMGHNDFISKNFSGLSYL